MLVAQCRKGDQKAQRLLFERFKGMVMGICLRYAGEEELAKDMLQETFIKVFTQLNDLNTQDALAGWIKTIAIRVAINYYKYHLNREHDRLDRITETQQQNDDHLVVLSGLAKEQLLIMIQELDDHYRLVFNLYCIEGYSHKEIAEQLTITERTSRVYLNRARKLIRHKIFNSENPRKQAYG